MKSVTCRIEIAEQSDGWWVGRILDAEGQVVYRSHSRSKEDSQSQLIAAAARLGHSVTESATITSLRPI